MTRAALLLLLCACTPAPAPEPVVVRVAAASASASAEPEPPPPPRPATSELTVLLDMSGSMKAMLGERTRFDVAKEALLRMLDALENERVGVVVFGKEPLVLCEQTGDYAEVAGKVKLLDFGTIDPTGTALGDAVGKGVSQLRRSSSYRKLVVVLTDGNVGENAGIVSADYAAEIALQYEVAIQVLQIGDDDDAVVQEGVDLFGKPIHVRLSMPLDRPLLRAIAERTRGSYVVATDHDAVMRAAASLVVR